MRNMNTACCGSTPHSSAPVHHPAHSGDPPLGRPILDERLPLVPPALHLAPHVVPPERLPDPPQHRVVRLDEKVARQGRQDRLKVSLWAGKVGWQNEQEKRLAAEHELRDHGRKRNLGPPLKAQMMPTAAMTRKSTPSRRRPSQNRSWVPNGTELA